MTSVEEGIAAQIRNIEARYGKPLQEWFSLIAASGLARHAEVVAMLKAPLHDQLMAMISTLGLDVGQAPKKGYISLRRPRKQFAMIQPSAAGRIDLGLILAGTASGGRREPSGSFNALFTHRVRVTAAGDLDDELAGWLSAAYTAAG